MKKAVIEIKRYGNKNYLSVVGDDNLVAVMDFLKLVVPLDEKYCDGYNFVEDYEETKITIQVNEEVYTMEEYQAKRQAWEEGEAKRVALEEKMAIVPAPPEEVEQAG